MAEPPELWLFAVTTLFVLVPGSLLTGLSLGAFRRRGLPQYRLATLGFLGVTLGTVGDALYQFLLKGSYALTGRELLLLQSVESALVGLGLVAMFLSLRGR